MIGAPNPGTFFADIETRISSMYKVAAQRRLCAEIEFDQTLDFGHMDYSLNHEGVPRFVDCKTAVYDSVLPPYKPKGHRSQESAPSKTLLPLLFLREPSRRHRRQIPGSALPPSFPEWMTVFIGAGTTAPCRDKAVLREWIL
jgi:hypothetical protein